MNRDVNQHKSEGCQPMMNAISYRFINEVYKLAFRL